MAIPTQPQVMGGPLIHGTQPTSRDTWGKGRVLRWHGSEWPALQNSHDSVDAHQARMLRLRRMLFPGQDMELDDAILGHALPMSAQHELRLMDLLDAWMWAYLHEPRIQRSPDFLDMRAEIIQLSGLCDVSEAVLELLG